MSDPLKLIAEPLQAAALGWFALGLACQQFERFQQRGLAEQSLGAAREAQGEHQAGYGSARGLSPQLQGVGSRPEGLHLLTKSGFGLV